MLHYLGCDLYEVQKQLPFLGYFVKRRDDRWEAIISSDTSGKGKYYHLPVDKPLLQTALNSITINAAAVTMPAIIPKPSSFIIKHVNDNTILSMIQNEPLYQSANMRFETVRLKDVVFLTNLVLNYKYINIDLIYQLYQDAHLSPFSAATVDLGMKESLVGPPVLEEHNGEFYVIEGNTRCYFSLRNGIETIEAIVVRNVTTPLPSSGKFKYEDIILTDNTLYFNKRYKNPKKQYFRHIERCLRPSNTYLI